MHGGKREGAGRKPSEPSKTIRVPVSLIPEFKARIELHRKGLSSVTEIKPEVQPVSVTEIKPDVQPVSVTEIKPEVQPVSVTEIKKEAPTASFDKEALKGLNRLPNKVKKALRAQYGSLRLAVEAGRRAIWEGGLWRLI